MTEIKEIAKKKNLNVLNYIQILFNKYRRLNSCRSENLWMYGC